MTLIPVSEAWADELGVSPAGSHSCRRSSCSAWSQVTTPWLILFENRWRFSEAQSALALPPSERQRACVAHPEPPSLQVRLKPRSQATQALHLWGTHAHTCFSGLYNTVNKGWGTDLILIHPSPKSLVLWSSTLIQTKWPMNSPS